MHTKITTFPLFGNVGKWEHFACRNTRGGLVAGTFYSLFGVWLSLVPEYYWSVGRKYKQFGLEGHYLPFHLLPEAFNPSVYIVPTSVIHVLTSFIMTLRLYPPLQPIAPSSSPNSHPSPEVPRHPTSSNKGTLFPSTKETYW